MICFEYTFLMFEFFLFWLLFRGERVGVNKELVGNRFRVGGVGLGRVTVVVIIGRFYCVF